MGVAMQRIDSRNELSFQSHIQDVERGLPFEVFTRLLEELDVSKSELAELTLGLENEGITPNCSNVANMVAPFIGEPLDTTLNKIIYNCLPVAFVPNSAVVQIYQDLVA